jgi:peptidoglycan/LPS O-acetylase OafA/YrhL
VSSTHRVGALDGIRAVSVLAVLAFHLGKLKGGFLGVEVFFVLSGYLITTHLLREHEWSGRIAIRRFYARRAQRLLPVLLVVLSSVGVVSFLLDEFNRNLLAHSVLTLFYVANWHEGGTQSFGPLGHMWSLSIEEQYYLVWPVALLLLLRISKPRRRVDAVLVASLALAILGWLARPIVMARDGDWVTDLYYGTASRGSGIVFGAAIAAFTFGRRPAFQNRLFSAVTWVAAATGMCSFFLFGRQSGWTYIVGLPLIDVCAALVILASLTAKSTLKRLLELKGLQYLGRISYGLYLWQLPVLWFVEGLIQGVEMRMVLQLVVPFILAAITYEGIERPMQDKFATIRGRRMANRKSNVNVDPRSE